MGINIAAPGAWLQPQQVPARTFICGYCDQTVASERGWESNNASCLRVCPYCQRPTYLAGAQQIPGIPFGAAVKSLPGDIEKIYEEARVCCSASAFTGAALLLRKLLMNVAVSVGSPEGATFMAYVEHLANNGYVPPNGKGWVDHIRKKGNEANHEITLMSKTDAEELIVFSEMLLKFIYEFPKRVPQSPTP